MDIKLYSTNCPKCKVVETKLKQMNIEFVLETDVDTVVSVGREKGIMSAPILQVDDAFMDFTTAIKYLKEMAS